MPDCDCLETCPFFNDRMKNMPDDLFPNMQWKVKEIINKK